MPKNSTTRKANSAAEPQLWFAAAAATPEARAVGLALDLALAAETARQSQGLSYAEVARRMGVSRAYANRLFQGHENSTLTSLVKLADALGLEVAVALKPSQAAFKSPKSAIKQKQKSSLPTGPINHDLVPPARAAKPLK